jgi:hypothetical protein
MAHQGLRSRRAATCDQGWISHVNRSPPQRGHVEAAFAISLTTFLLEAAAIHSSALLSRRIIHDGLVLSLSFVGIHDITAQIAKTVMGQGCSARDTKLNCDVEITARPEFASDPDELTLFTVEARRSPHSTIPTPWQTPGSSVPDGTTRTPRRRTRRRATRHN